MKNLNKGQLVCQHLENVSRDALEKHQDIIKDFVRRRHGLYALFKKGKLYYVGLASNLNRRLKHHLRDRHAQTWDRFSVYLTIGDQHLKELEALILRIASPKGNKQTGKFKLSQDIMPLFRKDIRDKYRKEIKDLFGRFEKKIKKQLISSEGKHRPVLAPFVTNRFQIRIYFKGKLHKAVVRRDGTISYKGKIYNSPSLAGKAVMKHAINGWTAWKYERAPGDWVMLHELRRK
jgi:predicted GIY-YIG superfamily endonuclease